MIILWAGFIAFVLVLIALDLGVFHREHKVISIQEALAWTGIWIALALAFNVFVFYLYENNWVRFAEDIRGQEAAVQFLTGYLLEKSLSVDNIFVISMIFAYFGVPLAEQHRVLFWGIIGAIVLRAAMILAGATLIDRFDWMIYVFGGLLLLSAAKMLVIRHDNIQLERNATVRLVRRFIPVTDEFHGGKFFVVKDGVRMATPLMLALVMVETSDVIFAIDSIPAIFAVTRDPFLVFTSNVFAILGLRSLYFAVAGMMERFRYLKSSLVFVLAYVGIKMMLSHVQPIPNLVSLAIITGILSVGLFASVFSSATDTAKLESPLVDYLEELVVSTMREARRVIILVFGMTVLVLGAALLVLPGPGLLVIRLALVILGAEFAWARLWLRRIKRVARSINTRIPGRNSAGGGDGK